MQFLTYLITLCLLRPLASVAFKPNDKKRPSVYIRSSYMCGERFLYSQPTLRNDATEGCSQIKRKYVCKGLRRCFVLRFKPTVKIYRGPHFTTSSEENAYESTLYEVEIRKHSLENAEILNTDRFLDEFIAVMEFDPISNMCTFQGVLRRSAGIELKCTEKPPSLQPSFSPSSSTRSLR
ncbi:hypothetical protein GcM1_185019 [Golovinomyces cichoracearum]|uniref:Secreted effector protein n=1 Tax=Golovinomyces cichoracearum TaxID=62708 RepID=A0A420J357_9PEZI|nr:hypothetical protein GcM1_185019 [Golovinomyces cichoracearum]